MRIRVLAVVLTLLSCFALTASAQFIDEVPDEVRAADTKVQKLQASIIIGASPGGFCRGVYAHTAVPTDWPEQEVRIVDEEISPGVKVTYRMIGGMVKAMEFRAARIRGGEELKAVVTFDVRRSSVAPPENTDDYVLPDRKKIRKDVRLFLAPSPLIQSNDRRIVTLAKKIGADEEKAWDRVEAIYDWVREKVEYKFDKKLRGALVALDKGVGDCEELTSLFVAICRAAGIPARTVHVVGGHCYPEFYLLDREGKGHWFPCQIAGTRAFGGIPELRPVLQKGDNVRPPQNRRDRQRYLANHAQIADTAGKPSVKFDRKAVSD